MDWLLSMLLNNAVVASVPALAAIVIWRRSGKAAIVHALWLLALIKLVTPPLVEVPVRVLAPAHEAIAAPVAVSESVLQELSRIEPPAPGISSIDSSRFSQNEPTEQVPMGFSMHSDSPSWRMDWVGLLILVWVTGAVGIAGVSIWRIWRFSKWLGDGVRADRSMIARAGRVAAELGLVGHRVPAVYFLDGAVSPMLWAWMGRAQLYLPAELCRRLTSDQLDSLLAHELAHFARRDHWVRYLELVAGVIYWWHPLVWIGRRQLRQAEEQCCDAWVLHALPGRARAYATALVDAVDYLADQQTNQPACASRGVRLASGAVSVSAKQLKRRLVMIMKNRQSRCLTTLGRVGILALGLAVVPMAPKWLKAEDGAARPAGEEKREKTVNGQFTSLEGTTLVLAVGDNGREMRVPTDGSTTVSIDGTAAKLSDLKAGVFVAARQVDGLTTRIDARAGRGMARFGAAVEGGAKREGEARRDGEVKREGPRDGEVKREGMRRDGEAKPAGVREGEPRREAVRREGEARPPEGRREGEARPAEGRREGSGLRVNTPRGKVEKIDSGKIVMAGREGRAGDAIPTDGKTRVWVNGKPAEISDIKPGMTVTLRTVEGITTEVDARSGVAEREGERPREGEAR